jgi:hypothetical protein
MVKLPFVRLRPPATTFQSRLQSEHVPCSTSLQAAPLTRLMCLGLSMHANQAVGNCQCGSTYRDCWTGNTDKSLFSSFMLIDCVTLGRLPGASRLAHRHQS